MAAGSGRLQNWLKFVLALAITLLFSFLFVRGIDLGEVGEALADANYLYVLPALGLFGGSLLFRSLRWRIFLQPEQNLPWQKLMPSLLVGYAGNNLLPLRAGELLRAQHLADKHGVSRMQTFGTLLMERLLDGFVLSTFVLWGLLLVDAGTAYLGVGLLLAGGTAAGFVVCTAIARDPALPAKVASLRILPFMNDARRERVAALGSAFQSGFSVLRSPRRLGLAAAASAGAWGLELAMYWLISAAFDLNASFITIAFAGSAANVAMSLPSAQGGVGPFHHFATEALLKFHIEHNAAAAYALALHMFLVVPVSLVGLFVLWRFAMPGKQQQRAVRAAVLDGSQ